MKVFKSILLFLFVLIFSLPVFAQTTLKLPQGRIGVYYRPEQYNPVYKTNITSEELVKISRQIKLLEGKDGISIKEPTKNSLVPKDIYKNENPDAKKKNFWHEFAFRKNKNYNSDFVNKQNIINADKQVSKQKKSTKNNTEITNPKEIKNNAGETKKTENSNSELTSTKEQTKCENLFHIKRVKSAVKNPDNNDTNKETINKENIKQEKSKASKTQSEKTSEETISENNEKKSVNKKFFDKNVKIFKKNKNEKKEKKTKGTNASFEQLKNGENKMTEICPQDYDTKQIVDEITAEINSEKDQMLADMRLLWVNAVQKSDTVYFAIMKLSNPNGEEVNKTGFKKILEPIIGAAPIVGQAFVNPALTAGSIIGSNVLGTALNDSVKQRLAKVNDADLVILARAIDELQQTLILSYMEYKNAYKEYQLAIKIADNRREEYENLNKKNSPDIILANTFYNEALDNQYKARQNFLMKRVVLEQLVGVEALLEVEKNSLNNETSEGGNDHKKQTENQ